MRHAPKTEEKKEQLSNDATASVNMMESEDTGLTAFLSSAHAYVIFPDVGKGGIGVGGA